MNTSMIATFQGLPLNATDALKNINDLLSAAEVCFSSEDNQMNIIGLMVLERARKYSVAASNNSAQLELKSKRTTDESAGTITESLSPTTIRNDSTGYRIQLARKNLGLSEADVARQLNTYSDHISDWECSTAEPSASQIIPLANALNCDPLWLLTGDNPENAQ